MSFEVSGTGQATIGLPVVLLVFSQELAPMGWPSFGIHLQSAAE